MKNKELLDKHGGAVGASAAQMTKLFEDVEDGEVFYYYYFTIITIIIILLLTLIIIFNRNWRGRFFFSSRPFHFYFSLLILSCSV